jgi:hypothetical protein
VDVLRSAVCSSSIGYSNLAMGDRMTRTTGGLGVLCPFCSSRDLEEIRITDRFAFLRCGKCALVSCRPRGGIGSALPRAPLARLSVILRNFCRTLLQ